MVSCNTIRKGVYSIEQIHVHAYRKWVMLMHRRIRYSSKRISASLSRLRFWTTVLIELVLLPFPLEEDSDFGS